MRHLHGLIFGLALCALFPSCSKAPQEPQVEQTTNKDRDWMVSFFQNSLISLSIDGSGAHFQTPTDGAKFVVGDPQKPAAMTFLSEFTLSKPGEMFYSPDHHSIKIFRVKQISADSVTLTYESSFNHQSFGKNLVSKDEGEITLKTFNRKQGSTPE